MKYFITLTVTSDDETVIFDKQTLEVTKEKLDSLFKKRENEKPDSLFKKRENEKTVVPRSRLPYYDMGNIRLTDAEINNYFTSDGDLKQPVLFEEMLRGLDYLNWTGNTPGVDIKPTRLIVNDKYVIEYTEASMEVSSPDDPNQIILIGTTQNLKTIEVLK